MNALSPLPAPFASHDPNEPITAFLKSYVAFGHAPRYAVLLNGVWGSGKSHLIKAFLDDTFRDRSNQFIYVSLYGIASAAELDDALFAAAYPLLETRGARLATGVGKAVLKHLKYELPELKANDILKRLKASVYVFDDLERATLPIDQVMGYINQLVEHEGKKVIVLANEDELVGERVAYTLRREKVVGRVFSVRPHLQAAVRSFVRFVDNPIAHPFLQDRLPLVCAIFQQADLGNLRILQQAMWDFERLCACLADRHSANPDAMNAMLSLVLPLAIDYKAGRLIEEDVADRQRYAAGMSKETKSRLESTRARYADSDVYDPVLTNDILVDLLVNGRVSSTTLADSLDQSRFFAPPSSEPAWQTVWYWQTRDAARVEAAIHTLEEQVAAREFVISGELLHVTGIRLKLAEAGLIPVDRQGVVDAAKADIDDLLARDKLEPPSRADFHQTGYASLGFMEANSSEFVAVYQYLSQARSEQAARFLPRRAKELLELMGSDMHRFRNALLVTGQGSGEYYGVPILGQIAPADFVAALERLPAENQRNVMDILRGRYEHEALTDRLAGERAWLEQVGDVMEELAGTRTGFTAYRLNTFVRWFMREPIAAAEATLQAQAEASAKVPSLPFPTIGDQS